MIFSISSDTLGKNIQGLSKMMTGKSSLPILDHFLFEIDGNILNATASDGENWQLTCRVVEGRYPNYDSIIPTDNDKAMLIDKRQLQEAIRRMLPMGNQQMKTIKMEIDYSLLTLSCQDIDFNTSAKETMPCEYNGSSMVLGVNGDILNAILSQMPSDNVRITLNEAVRPLLIMPADETDGLQVTALLMPTLLSD